MKMRTAALALILASLPLPSRADDPPEVDHQPVPCTIPDKAISICATVTDDNQVAKARVYFHRAGQDFYNFVDMAFQGLSYCATLPGPREGAMQVLEYYVQAVDNQYQAKRTSTYAMSVKPEGACDFPPLEKNAGKAAAITVFATHKKQGKKLDDAFVQSGVTFVPIQGK